MLTSRLSGRDPEWTWASCRAFELDHDFACTLIPSLVVWGEWREVCAQAPYQASEHLCLILGQAFECLLLDLEGVGRQIFDELESLLCRRDQHAPCIHC